MPNDLIRSTVRAGKDFIYHFVQLLDVTDEETEAHGRGWGFPLGLTARKWRPEQGTSSSSELRPRLLASRLGGNKGTDKSYSAERPLLTMPPRSMLDFHFMDEETGSNTCQRSVEESGP